MRIPTAEIVVNGRKKIVNADDPRAKGASHAVQQEEKARAVKPKRGRAKKASE